jgi:hypothetical protein
MRPTYTVGAAIRASSRPLHNRSHPMRFRAPALAAALLTVVLAACQDSATAPRTSDPARSLTGLADPVEPVRVGPAFGDPTVTVAGRPTHTFSLDPRVDNVYKTHDGHTILIPAGAICRVEKSGYGVRSWELPCEPETRPVVFTIRSALAVDGRPHVDVFPDVRFSPKSLVTIRFDDSTAAATPGAKIVYCPSGAKACVDESARDRTLQTFRDSVTGQVFRRIKHFSGYLVILDVDCDQGFDPSCPGDDGFLRAGLKAAHSRASGYITTTGFGGTDHD